MADKPFGITPEELELARACALEAVKDYGDRSEVTYQRILIGGIWNDHVAVQAAVATIVKLTRNGKLTEVLDAVKEVRESTDDEFLYSMPEPLSSAMLSLVKAWQEYENE